MAVWLGPGHVQEFYRGIPNCMVIDSENEAVKRRLVEAFRARSGGRRGKNMADSTSLLKAKKACVHLAAGVDNRV